MLYIYHKLCFRDVVHKKFILLTVEENKMFPLLTYKDVILEKINRKPKKKLQMLEVTNNIWQSNAFKFPTFV